MFQTGSDLVPGMSVTTICAARDRSLILFEEGFAKLAEAEREAAKAAPNTHGILGALDAHRAFYDLRHDGSAGILEALRRRLDADAWGFLRDVSGLRNLMDARSLSAFSEQIEKEPPALTMENVQATFSQFRENAGAIFERGVVAVFEGLSTHYKTNSKLAFGRRVILNAALNEYGWNYRLVDEAAVNDLDRIFHLLDKREAPDFRGGAAARVGTQRRKVRGRFEVDTTYMHLRAFANGNLHITFKRADLMDQMNAILTRHYGATLADDSHRS